MASSPEAAPPPDSEAPPADLVPPTNSSSTSPPTNSTSPPPPETSTPRPLSAPPPSPLPPSSPPPSLPPPSLPPPHSSPPPPASSPPTPPAISPPTTPASSPPPPKSFQPIPQNSPPPPPDSTPPQLIFSPPPSTPAESSPPSPTFPPPSSPSLTPATPAKPTPSSFDILPPPPPRSPAKAPPSHSSPATDGKNANPNKSSGGSHTNLPMVVGIVSGIALFILITGIVACIFCRKKKKKKRPNHPMHYYPNQVQGGDYYNSGPSPTKLYNGGQDAMVRIPPPPGMAWHASPTPTAMTGETSTNDSGTHGQQPLNSPSPPIALGFVKSTFSYEELAEATNGFSNENLIGQGGFGYVYKGVLPSGKEVAVKQLKAGSGQGEREFQAEVEIISRVHHRHLVSLVGYCIFGSQRLLVYDFVPNKTLEFHLHGKNQPTMDWPTRMKIALGSAKGLAYLHEDCHPRIIHRDIKAANILLDYRFEAMVADFGLAKLTSDTYTHVSTRVMGTFGYLAPEYASSGKLSEKSDVFSFGVMLLELVTGKKPVDSNPMEDSLVDWARPLMTQALTDENYDLLADPRLEGDYNKTEMARMVACAATSVRHSAKRRPKMSQIVRALEGDSSLEDLTEGMKPGQSTHFTSSSDYYDSGSYASNMSRFRRAAFGSNDFSQGYSGQTSDYGLNQSTSSSSSEITAAIATHSRRSGQQ